MDEAIEQAQRGDEMAFESLLRATGDRLYTNALHVLRDPARAEQATERAIVEIWRRLPELTDRSAFLPWANRVLLESGMGRVGRRERRQSDALAKTDDSTFEPTIPLPPHVLENALARVSQTTQRGPGWGSTLGIDRSLAVMGIAAVMVTLVAVVPMLAREETSSPSAPQEAAVATASPTTRPTPSPTPIPRPTPTPNLNDPVIGTWLATDVDASALTLMLEPLSGSTLAATLIDEQATICTGQGVHRMRYFSTGVAVHTHEGMLEVQLASEQCGTVDIHADAFARRDSIILRYDPGRDELSGLDVTWVRAEPVFAP